MNDWNIIWNSFCDEVTVSVKKKNLEIVFEKDIASEFFRALNWYRLNKGLVEQYSIKFGTAFHRADFALFALGNDKPEIIVELKRPNKKKSEADGQQLIDYMKKEACSYGILLLGEKLELYYINYNTAHHEALLVETISYQHDNEAARQLMEVLYRDTYNADNMAAYCLKRVEINKSIEYWCSSQGKTEIMSMIIERSKLPEPLLETLRTTLVVDVHRRDGLAPIKAENPKVSESGMEFRFKMPKAGVDAVMLFYRENKRYVIKAGSIIMSDTTGGSAGMKQFRKEVIANKKLVLTQGKLCTLLQDINIPDTSASPSGAASFCSGTSYQGTEAWVDRDGKKYPSDWWKE